MLTSHEAPLPHERQHVEFGLHTHTNDLPRISNDWLRTQKQVKKSRSAFPEGNGLSLLAAKFSEAPGKYTCGSDL